jgi:hypothetical protein
MSLTRGNTEFLGGRVVPPWRLGPTFSTGDRRRANPAAAAVLIA